MSTPNLQPGQRAVVSVHDSRLKQTVKYECEIVGIVSALDRDYRVTVRLLSGVELRECAPECVTEAPEKLETCTRCGEKLRNYVWLQLNSNDGLYYGEDDHVPAEHSQGCFPFGIKCATIQLRDTLSAISKGERARGGSGGGKKIAI